MDEWRGGDVSSKAHTLFAPHGHILAIATLLAAICPWMCMYDAVVGVTMRETAISAVALAIHSVVALSLLVWAIRPTREHRYDYWLITAMGMTTSLCSIFIPLNVDHLDVIQALESRNLLRLASTNFAVINVVSLLPRKAWALSCFTLLPVIIIHPVMCVLQPQSWDQAQGFDGWLLYAISLCIMIGVVAGSLASSYTSKVSYLALQASQLSLDSLARRSQGLLETAMPAVIARALISGVPPEALTGSFESASVAFIALTSFDSIAARLQPRELLEWLHAVFQSLDALVDAYNGDITKVETVANVYLVASGLPNRLPPSHHARALAEFCVDVLRVLKSGLPAGVEPATAKAGIHVGPVTAGLIGRTRRYYRVFGDTVNVASRMMSTGEAGRVQVSEATVRALLSQAEGPLPFAHPGTSVGCDVSAAPSGAAALPLFIESRGLTAVKGKGLIPTFWVAVSPSAVTSDMSALTSHRKRFARLARDVFSIPDTGRTHLDSSPDGFVKGGAPALYLHRVARGVYEGGVDLSMQSSVTGDSDTSPVSTPMASSSASPRSVHSRIGHVHAGVPPVLPAVLVDVAKTSVDFRSHDGNGGLPGATVAMPQSVHLAANASPAQRMIGSSVYDATAGGHGLGLLERVDLRAQHRATLPYPLSTTMYMTGPQRRDTDVVSVSRRSPEASVVFSRDNLLPGMVLGSSSPSAVSGDYFHTRCTRQEMPRLGEELGPPLANDALASSDDAFASSTDTLASSNKQPAKCSTSPNAESLSPYAPAVTSPSAIASTSHVSHAAVSERYVESSLRILRDFFAWASERIAHSRLRFRDDKAERDAQRALFLHTLRGVSASMSIWCVCWVCIAVINAVLAPQLSSTIHSSAGTMVVARQGFALSAIAFCSVLFIAARMAWAYQQALSDTVIQRVVTALVVIVISYFGIITWLFTGSGPALTVPFASAGDAGVSADAEAGFFQGHILLSVVLIAYVQAVAHMRLPFAQSAVVMGVTLLLIVCVAPPQIIAAEPNVPVAFTVVAVFGTVVFVVGNLFTATVASYLWEWRLRHQLITVAAAVAAEADSTRILRNLMPTSVVAKLTSGQTVVPTCAEDVVILFGDIVGFTTIASGLDPTQLMAHLNAVFSDFDNLVEARGLWKLETVGDAYIVAGGLFDGIEVESARGLASSRGISSTALAVRSRLDAAFSAGLAMLVRVRAGTGDARFDALPLVQDVLRLFRVSSGLDLQMRIGIHIGSAVHGIVGSESPRFCAYGRPEGLHLTGVPDFNIPPALPRGVTAGVLGEALAVAERTQAHATPGTINCSAAAHAAYLASSYLFVPLGGPAPHPPAVDTLAGGAEPPTAALPVALATAARTVDHLTVGGLREGDEGEVTVWRLPTLEPQPRRVWPTADVGAAGGTVTAAMAAGVVAAATATSSEGSPPGASLC